MRTSGVILAASAVAAVVAQSSTSTVTEYYDDCTETPSGTEAPLAGTPTGYSTVTATDTITFCPICADIGMSTFPGGSYTTYKTVLQASCPTGGLEDHTYTITEPCPSSGLDREASTYMPQGFTTTTVPCGCAENTPVAITTPGPAYMSAAAKAPAAAPAEATAAPGGSSPAEAPATGGSAPVAGEAPAVGGSSPGTGSSPAGAPAPGAAAPAGGSPPYPAPAAEGKVASPSGSAVPASNASAITPFTGIASQLTSVYSVIATLVMMITAFAFAL